MVDCTKSPNSLPLSKPFWTRDTQGLQHTYDGIVRKGTTVKVTILGKTVVIKTHFVKAVWTKNVEIKVVRMVKMCFKNLKPVWCQP